jgi:hypothetical protein
MRERRNSASFVSDSTTTTSTIPMVVLTPESPTKELLSPGTRGGEVKTLFAPLPPRGCRKTLASSTGCCGGSAAASCVARTPRNAQSRQTEQAPPSNKYYILGKASNLTATCLDIDEDDLLNNNNNGSSSGNGTMMSEDEDTGSSSGSSSTGTGRSSLCSLSTTTLSHGELRLMQPDSASPVATTAFTTIRCKSITVAPGCAPRTSSTTSTIFSPVPSAPPPKHDCPEHPFRKVFAKRKEFYQTIGERKENFSSVNRLLWRKRHCTLCCADSRNCSKSPNITEHDVVTAAASEQQVLHHPVQPKSNRITLNANIEPFAPFTIQHDLDSGEGAVIEDNKDAAGSSSSDIVKFLNVAGGGGELSSDGKELRYAKSTINSEDGVESHLEVSVGVDGSSVVTTTRHKRLGSPSEFANTLRLGFDEDRKVLNIEQSTARSRPNSMLLPMLLQHKSNSAYCTQMAAEEGGSQTLNAPGGQAGTNFEQRYNSLPNWYGGRPPPEALFLNALAMSSPQNQQQQQNQMYKSHPADEEKRMAFTRGNDRPTFRAHLHGPNPRRVQSVLTRVASFITSALVCVESSSIPNKCFD